MANFEAVTTSNGIKVTPEQRKALMDVVDKYYFAMEDYMFGNGNEFGIWGYDWLCVLDNDEDANPADEEFFEEIRPLIPEGKKLIIECAGHEKLRYVNAARFIIGPDGIEYRYLDGPEDHK